MRQKLTPTPLSHSPDVHFFKQRATLVSVTLIATILWSARTLAQTDPLPSWNDTAPKKTIIAFVEKVTKESSPDFVPVAERIAVFDNDGTLWAEKPVPVQLFFTIDRGKTLAPQHPEWKTNEPFASLLKGNMKDLAASGEKGVLALMAATHAGLTTEEFSKIVTDWIATAKHSQTGKL